MPTVVTAKGKAHVSGLHQNDFELHEDGALKKITVFEEVRAGAVPLRRPAMLPQVFSNLATTDAVPRRLNIIVIDEINTRFLDQTLARRETIKYLSTAVTSDELTQLLRFTPAGVEVITDFSSDPKVLVEALQRVRGRLSLTADEPDVIPPGPNATEDLRRLELRMAQFFAQSPLPLRSAAVERTFDAFEAIAHSCLGLPGRKSLIWISAGFPFLLPEISVLLPQPVPMRHVGKRLEKIFDALNAANVAVYPVDPSGLPGFAQPVWAYPSSASRMGTYRETIPPERNIFDHELAVQTMEEMARRTGGFAYHDANDISGAIARATDDSAAYYMLGYYVSRSSTKPGWHKLKVRVRQRHLSVRARSGYFLLQTADFAPDEVRARDIANAVASPLDLTGIPMTVRFLRRTPDSGKTKIDFELESQGLAVDPEQNNHLSLQVVAFVSDEKLNEITRIDQMVNAHLKAEQTEQLRNGMRYTNRLLLPPGTYSVKFVIRDNINGRVGSLSVPLTVD